MNRPRPVLTANSIAGGIKAIGLILGFLGLNQAQDWVGTESSVLISITLGVVTLGGDLLAALHAQGKVTPLVDPLAADGTPLVKVSYLPSEPLPPLPALPRPQPTPAVSPDALDLPDVDAVLAQANEIHPA